MALGGLDIALSGLRVAQQQLSVIANNVSNVNTEGYTRKILPQQTVVVGGDGAGARANPIIRNVNLNLERDFWTQVSTVNALEVKSKYLERIQQFHGSPDLEVSIAAEVAKLRDAFSTLADSPEDTFLQRAVVDQAERLSGKIRDFADLLTEMRNDTQEEMTVTVDSINQKLANIAELNQQIKFNNISNKTTAELEDKRDQLISELSEEINISFFTRGDGVLVVQTTTGVQLADERAETLYFNAVPVGPSTYYPNPVNPNSNGIFVGGNPADNPLAIDITQSGLDGTLGALLELRDEILPEQQAILDELAHKMATRFHEQGLDLYTDASGFIPGDATANLIGNVDITGALALSTGVNDVFAITLNSGGVSPAPETITIDLSNDVDVNVPVPFPDAASALVGTINARIAALPDAYSNTSASIDANGQLNITSDYDINIEANPPGVVNGMGDAGLAALGLTRGTEYAAPKTNPLTPVPYVGFANEIRVNQLVLDNNTLVQQGTAPTDQPVQVGSNEVIRRILEFTFGDVEYQEAIGDINLLSSAGGDDLQTWLGIFSENSIAGSKSLSPYSDISQLIAAGGEAFTPDPPTVPPILDQFTITFEESRTAPPLGPTTITVDLTDAEANFPIGGPVTNALDQLINEINSQIALAGVDPALAAQASYNSNGQLIIESRGNVTIDNGFIGGMTDAGLEFLGLTAHTYVTQDPYIDIQIGNDPPVRVTIEPGDDEVDLYNKLLLVPGLSIDDSLTTTDGFLRLRPGDDPNNPTFGGDLKITGGPFEVELVLGTGPDAQPTGTSIIEALFGTGDPVTDVPHEISTGTGTYESFRRTRLGPAANIETGIISATSLVDFAQKMINRHAAQKISIDQQITDESGFRDLLQRRLLDESGVNIDEELSNLILMQTAFSAAARVVSAIDEEFEELLNAVR